MQWERLQIVQQRVESLRQPRSRLRQQCHLPQRSREQRYRLRLRHAVQQRERKLGEVQRHQIRAEGLWGKENE